MVGVVRLHCESYFLSAGAGEWTPVKLNQQHPAGALHKKRTILPSQGGRDSWQDDQAPGMSETCSSLFPQYESHMTLKLTFICSGEELEQSDTYITRTVNHGWSLMESNIKMAAREQEIWLSLAELFVWCTAWLFTMFYNCLDCHTHNRVFFFS